MDLSQRPADQCHVSRVLPGASKSTNPTQNSLSL